MPVHTFVEKNTVKDIGWEPDVVLKLIFTKFIIEVRKVIAKV